MASFSAGCIEDNDSNKEDEQRDPAAFDPEDGDLVLLIEMETISFNGEPRSMGLNISLVNAASKILWIEDDLRLGLSLWPNITYEDGSEVVLLYMDILDYNPKYSNLNPGQKFETKIDLIPFHPIFKFEDKTSQSIFERSGQYNISFSWWGSETNIEVRSNIIAFNIE